LINYEITYDIVMESSCVGGRDAVSANVPQKV